MKHDLVECRPGLLVAAQLRQAAAAAEPREHEDIRVTLLRRTPTDLLERGQCACGVPGVHRRRRARHPEQRRHETVRVVRREPRSRAAQPDARATSPRFWVEPDPERAPHGGVDHPATQILLVRAFAQRDDLVLVTGHGRGDGEPLEVLGGEAGLLVGGDQRGVVGHPVGHGTEPTLEALGPGGTLRRPRPPRAAGRPRARRAARRRRPSPGSASRTSVAAASDDAYPLLAEDENPRLVRDPEQPGGAPRVQPPLEDVALDDDGSQSGVDLALRAALCLRPDVDEDNAAVQHELVRGPRGGIRWYVAGPPRPGRRR